MKLKIVVKISLLLGQIYGPVLSFHDLRNGGDSQSLANFTADLHITSSDSDTCPYSHIVTCGFMENYLQKDFSGVTFYNQSSHFLFSNHTIKDLQDINSRLIITYGKCSGFHGFYVIVAERNYGYEHAPCFLLSIETQFINDILQQIDWFNHAILHLNPVFLDLLLAYSSQYPNLHFVHFYLLWSIKERDFDELKEKFMFLRLERINSADFEQSLDRYVLDFQYQKINLQSGTNNNKSRHVEDAKQNRLSILRPNQSRKKKHAILSQKITIRVATVFFKPLVFEFIDNSTTNQNGVCFKGHNCRIPVVQDETNHKTRIGCCIGYFIDVFNLLERKMGFTYELYVVPDGAYGALIDGRWNGMIGELVAGRADVALQSLSVTYQRQRVVDFVPYLLTSNFGLIRSISRTDQKQSFKIRWDFATALSTMLAASFLCATILVIVFLYVHENLLHWLFAANVYFPIGEIFTYTLGLAFQRDMGALNPRQWSGRLVALGYAAAMTVFMSAYTAKICASSIDNQPLDDFKGFSGPEFQNPSNSYKIGTITGRGQSQEEYFKNHNLEQYRKMHDFMLENSVQSDEEALEKILNGTLQAHIIEVTSVVQGLASKLSRHCDKVTVYEENLGQHELTFAYAKGFTYGKQISDTLQRMKDREKFEPIRKKWIQESFCFTKVVSQQFEWTYFSGILVIMGISLVLSTLILLVENLYVHFGLKNALDQKKRRGSLQNGASSYKQAVISKTSNLPYSADNNAIIW